MHGDVGRELTLQEKIVRGKQAIKAAGFMAHPRYQPKGNGVQVYVLIPIALEDFSMTEVELAEEVRKRIQFRCMGKPKSFTTGPSVDIPPPTKRGPGRPRKVPAVA